MESYDQKVQIASNTTTTEFFRSSSTRTESVVKVDLELIEERGVLRKKVLEIHPDAMPEQDRVGNLVNDECRAEQVEGCSEPVLGFRAQVLLVLVQDG